MAPNNPWNNLKKKSITSSESSFPGLQPTAATEIKSQYEDIQDDELIALESIYGEDFQRLETKGGAWKKAEPSFSIRIKSSDEELSVTLQVTFVATYPKSPPLLFLKDDGDLREGTKYKLQNVVEMKPKEMVAKEQVMVMDIVDSLQEILEDAAKAKAAGKELPSLEEERAIHEMTAARIAKEQEMEEEKKRQDETKEEERILNTMVQDEVNRQRAKAKEAKRKSKPPIISKELFVNEEIEEQRDRVVFDQPLTLLDEDNNLRQFQVVTDKVRIRRGPVSDCYTVRPILKGNSFLVTLALKEAELNCYEKENAQFKANLRNLELTLEAVKKTKHRNLLEIFDFKVQKNKEKDGSSESTWTVSILSEFANKGSLEELLDIAGGLGVEKVRTWTIELLDALRYLHDRGIVHQDLIASNILLVRSPSGDMTAKLSDAGFQHQLYNLKSVGPVSTLTIAKSAYWLPPENANAANPQFTQKTDIWDFGIVFLQMIFGMGVLKNYASPNRVMEALNLSESLNEILHKFFKGDPKKRPRAFELSSSEFLATDAPIMANNSTMSLSMLGSINSLMPATPGRARHDSTNAMVPFSRFKEDFTEEGRLGKGGFGEVVKARKKLDGQFYAIKKISQKSSSSLTEVLKEVRLLSQLSHPYVVRYYNTWTEEVPEVSDTEDDTISTIEESASALFHGPNIDFGASTGGLDFISSSGFPAIEFGYASDENAILEEDDVETEEDEDFMSQSHINATEPDTGGGKKLALNRTRSDSRYQRSTRTILYIQMEYCERRTLRDLIKRGLYKDENEIWRFLRQTLEGLVHIHSLNVVHRDLKPENIFIDGALNVRIGDFGLATSGQYSVPDKINIASGSHNMTTSIGTASYVAPEVRSSVGTYNSKVDMYSLGIILFEMCYPPILGMERAHVLQSLRQKQPALPPDFNRLERAIEADIILSLLDHNPKERPSSSGLLQSGKLPLQMESETIRQTLAGLSDPKSPYYQKMMASLFSRPMTQAKDFAWDMDGSPTQGVHDLMLQTSVKQKLASIFRRHGALETSRMSLFPRSGHYGLNVVQLLDSSGTLVQLPYDLTLPYARSVAKHVPPIGRSFTFGHVFRDKGGGQPQSFGEVDFDIVSDSLDLALKEAEVIKVMDEILQEFPSLAASQMCFHINHSDMLSLVFEFCRIELDMRPAVAEVLSKLNIQQWTWQKIRNELRSPLIGVAATSLDDLQRFDFRDTPLKAFQRLKTIFEGTSSFEKASSAIAHLNEVIAYLRRLEIRSKVFVNPLSSLKEKFYRGGILFSCLYDSKRRDVFAAGGRYDSLISEFRPRMGDQSEDRHAVGFSLAWERLSTSMARFQKSSSKTFLKRADEEPNGIWTARRVSDADSKFVASMGLTANSKKCDVLVASFDPTILRSSGVEVLNQLWTNDISAELAVDSRSPEDLLSKYRDDQHYWIVIIKQDSILKVKTMGRKEIQDTDIPMSQLLPWLASEIRDRDQRDGIFDRTKLVRHISQPSTVSGVENEQEVRLLVAQTKSKKSHRRNLVEQAQSQAASLVHSFLDGPILAIETTDHVLELIRETRLSDADSWRKVSQSVTTAEKRYIGEIYDMMKNLAFQNKDTTRNSFIYNFRTGTCIFYDLGV